MKLKPGPKTGLVTHKGCLDGTGSALMFLWAGGRRENILFRNPSTCDLTPEEAAPFDEVWFADLCPSTMDDPAGGKPFLVFDHHASNARKFADSEHCTFSMVHSGTSLLGEKLGVYDPEWINLQFSYGDTWNPEEGMWERAKLVQALEAYDLGKFDHEQGMYLADLASSYSQDEMLDLLKKHEREVLSLPDCRGRVAALSSMRKIFAESATRNIVPFRLMDTDFETIRAGATHSPVYWKNEVAQRILAAGYDVAVVIDPGGMVSLRSLPGGPDCSIIAGRYGGGGHPRAAGFKANSTNMIQALIDETFG